ncbi:MAG: heparinase II/III family protein [Planctomycetes bacterium]|nr:heparinase II/III family protein [Planctomycetota bacterium]MBU4399362.1 heparinase II/III family protein [Planctomycetota bacterium]MCG2685628.1 heparinase II/III family protein [Planctomycetales bacterium]
MNHACRVTLFVVIVLFPAVGVSMAAKVEPPEEKQIERWTRLLPESPRGVGPTIEDRRAWRVWAENESGKEIVKRAERLLTEPMPELSDELYLDYSRTGNRDRYQRVLWQRRSRLTTLVMAECIEDRGRFLPAIETSIRGICGDKTWVLPAHDRGLANFKGTVAEIDLSVADFSWNLATARYWLSEKLTPEVRKLIRDELERRTFTPFTKMVTTGKPQWWLTTTNNWNAVCLAGVTGSALAIIESRPRRAFFAAAAEKYIQNFLSGFTPDGYCSEGLGYWNYGFGHYVMLAETLRQASGGEVDLLEGANVRRIALFGRRMEILPGVYPAFADCSPTSRPDPPLMALLGRRYGWGLKNVEAQGRAGWPSSYLHVVVLFSFPNEAAATPAEKTPANQTPPRDWFPDAGVLICRPVPAAQHALGAALKGGHNAEHHNHNDVGSFVVALGRATPLLDPGHEIYTARTFNKHRYESKVLNSFGHPVPRVAGQLQSGGRQAAARVLNTDFTDKADTLVLDLTSAYKVKELNKLERTFVFSREGAGKLTVTDSVEFDSPQSFGTAWITFDNWKQLAPNRLQVGKKPDDVIVEIDARGAEFRVVPEKIEEQLPGGRVPTRLGIELTEPVVRATVSTTVTPAP